MILGIALRRLTRDILGGCNTESNCLGLTALALTPPSLLWLTACRLYSLVSLAEHVHVRWRKVERLAFDHLDRSMYLEYLIGFLVSQCMHVCTWGSVFDTRTASSWVCITLLSLGGGGAEIFYVVWSQGLGEYVQEHAGIAILHVQWPGIFWSVRWFHGLF